MSDMFHYRSKDSLRTILDVIEAFAVGPGIETKGVYGKDWIPVESTSALVFKLNRSKYRVKAKDPVEEAGDERLIEI